jgi:2-methylcitrate dehydratase
LTKTFPTNGELHTAIWAGIELKPQITDIDAIQSIRIDTSEFNRRVLADPEKWHPTTRETADHSLPYNVARALFDGDITLESYSPANILAPEVQELMSKTTVAEDPKLTAMFPKQLANRVTVTLTSGELLTSEVTTGPGGLEQPMSDADFEQKFRKMAAPHLGQSAQDRAIDYVKNLESQAGFGDLFLAMEKTS